MVYIDSWAKAYKVSFKVYFEVHERHNIRTLGKFAVLEFSRKTEPIEDKQMVDRDLL